MSHLWSRCLERLKAELPTDVLLTLIHPLQASEGNGQLALFAPNAYVVEHLQPHLQRINELATHFASVPVEVKLAVGSLPRASVTAANGAPAPGSSATVAIEEGDGVGPNPGAANSTFENFVEGRSNQLAKAAAWKVAHSPGDRSHNPLLLYGSTGLGKTHLMYAIGHQMRRLNPAARVLYLRSEQFFAGMRRAMLDNAMDAFKRQFQQLDALLIDDVQFFAGKDRTQEEFFHTFNALIDARQQIILSCDRYPREVEGIEPRLRSRLAWGLSVPIEPPDFETRAAIMLSKARESGIGLPEDVAYLLARKLHSNVRDLEGALKTLALKAYCGNQPITVELAQETLRDSLRAQQQAIAIEKIQKTVADYYQIRLADMASKLRSRAVVRPRQMAMALARELTDHSLPEIGSRFGDRDHSTVIHACAQVAKLTKSDPRIGEDWTKLIRKLTE